MTNTNLLYQDYLRAFSQNEHAVKIIFDHTNHQIVHISENVEQIFGYSPNDIYNDLFRFEQQICPFFIKKWTKEMYNYLSNVGMVQPVKLACCGMSAFHKNGQGIRILSRYHQITSQSMGNPNFIAISLDDVTHLMKLDFYWARIEAGNQKYCFYSNHKNYCWQDVISIRESQVLSLLAQGFSSKQIGNQLFISTNTVDNHRRNMIARTGVRDTTALVQLCRMLGLI